MARLTMRELQGQIQELREQNERMQALLEAQSQATGILQEINEDGYETAMEEAQDEEFNQGHEPSAMIYQKVSKVPSNLPKFTGKEGEAVRNWILRLENACRVSGHIITDSSTILPSIAGTAMETPADGFFLQWSASTPAVKRTWKNFKETVRKHFEGSSFQNNLRKRLQDLKHTNTIEEYNNEYFHIIQQVENMSEVDKITYYTEGLKAFVKGQVCFLNPTTLNDAMDIALRYERAHFPKGKTSDNKGNSTKSQGKIFKTSKKFQSTYFKKDKGQFKDKSGKKKSSIMDITCHYCKKKGHKKQDCYKRKNDEQKKSGQNFKNESGNSQPHQE